MRFEELERRCVKLKKVRIIRIVFSIASIFIVVFSSYYWMHHNQEEPLLDESLLPQPSITRLQIPLIDQNESNTSIIVEEVATKIEGKALFLAPHIYKNSPKLPSSETEIATQSLKQEQQLLKRYNAVQNFNNAYALAYFYFEQKSYKEVVLWTKETSKHNSSSEKPWILYAKAKFYLGDRAEAIRSLELFLSYINSMEAQELLNFYKGQE